MQSCWPVSNSSMATLLYFTWMLESQRLREESQTRSTFVNIVTSVGLGVIAVLLRQWATEQL